MTVLVDSSVWSLALRRRRYHLNEPERQMVATLTRLIETGEAKLIGPIRQELLSGIRYARQFEKLREELRAFQDELLESADYEAAAEMANHCLSKGIAYSAIDILICAVAKNRDWQIFSTDQDFNRYVRALGFTLFEDIRQR